MEEVPTRIEPCLFDEGLPTELSEMASHIAERAALLGAGLHPDTVSALASLTQIVNAYYSNLIEGHAPRFSDLTTALDNPDNCTSSLALETLAHIAVQRDIDSGDLPGIPSATSAEFISSIHRGLYERMPVEFCSTGVPENSVARIVPGEFRREGSHEVVVGRHQPPSSARVAAFMAHFEKRYGSMKKGGGHGVATIAAAHHRLNYIHPFPDGNGRVSRLVSHVMARQFGIDGNGLWALSRGLALGLQDNAEYKRMMDYADHPRMGDRDGRGNLSLRALKDFCGWFMRTMLRQIDFSLEIFDIATLEKRYKHLAASVARNGDLVVSTILHYGMLDVSVIASRCGIDVNEATQIVELVSSVGIVKIDERSGRFAIGTPIGFHEELFPGLLDS